MAYDMGSMVANLRANTKDYAKGMGDAVKQAQDAAKGVQTAFATSSSGLGKSIGNAVTAARQHWQVLKTVFRDPSLAKQVSGIGVNLAASLGKMIPATSGIGKALSGLGSTMSGAFAKVGPAVGAMGGLIKGAAAAAVAAIGTVAAAATVAVGVVAGVFAGMFAAALNFAKAAAPVEGVRNAFMGLASTVQGGGDAMLAALQKASMGMVSSTDLMMQFNKASQLVSTQFASQLPEALTYLSKVASSTGESLDYMLNSLTVGIGRLSPRILDNLGVQVSLTDAYGEWATAMDRTVESMTQAEQQAALMDYTMKKLSENTANIPSIFGSAHQVMTAFSVDLAGIKTAVGMDLLPTFAKLFTMFHQFLPAIKAFGQGFAGTFAGITQVAGTIIKSLGRAMGVDFSNIAGNSQAWGENIVMSLARGMVNAIGAVISALNTLGGIIANWLAPGSPPKLLPELPAWGQSAANYFLQGMTMADISILRDLSGQVENFMRSIMPEASQQELAQAILDARDALETAVSSGGNILGSLPQEMQAYASALLQVSAASDAVAAAEATVASQHDAVAAAQANLNQITQRYEQALNPISARLKEIQGERDDFTNNKRREDLKKIIEQAQAAGNTDAVRFAQLELEELDLKDQQASIEEAQAAEEALGQSAVDAAQAQLEADQAALELAQEAASAAEEQLQVQQELLAHQIETNNLLNDLMGTAEGAGGAMAAAAGGAGSFAEALENLAGGAGAAAGGIGSSISALAQSIIDEFATLTGPAEELGTTWGTVFTNIGLKIDEVKTKVTTFVTSALTSFTTMKTDLVTGLTTAVLTFQVAWTTAWQFIEDALSKAWGFIKPLWDDWVNFVNTSLIPSIEAIRAKWVDDTWPAITRALSHAWKSISGVWEEIGRWINDNLVPWFELVKTYWIEQVWNPMAEALTAVWNSTIQPILEDIQKWFETTIVPLLDTASAAWDRIWASMAKKVGEVKGDILAFFDRIEQFATWLANHLFKFEISLPDLPDWAVPGSPLPIHTAWANFASELNRTTIEPTFQMAGMGGYDPTAVDSLGQRLGAMSSLSNTSEAGSKPVAQSTKLADTVNIHSEMDWAEFKTRGTRLLKGSLR